MSGQLPPISPRSEPRFFNPNVIGLALLLVFIGNMLFATQLGVRISVVIAILCLVGILGIGIYGRLKLSKIGRLIQTHGRFLCLNCHYPLTGLPDVGHCPECHHPYDRPTNERRWRSWEEGVNKGKPLA